MIWLRPTDLADLDPRGVNVSGELLQEFSR